MIEHDSSRERRASPADRRNVTLTLTGAGRALVDKVTWHRRTTIERVLQTMPVGPRARLAEVAGRLS
jgi:DNA-binding MarR family transcriptional regulator